jgi:hypothetical protein
MRSKSSQRLFSIIDLAKWAPRITKYKVLRGIGRTNEAAGLIALAPKFSSKKYLVSPRVAYSASEVHELVAQSWYTRRWSCLDRVPLYESRPSLRWNYVELPTTSENVALHSAGAENDRRPYGERKPSEFLASQRDHESSD